MWRNSNASESVAKVIRKSKLRAEKVNEHRAKNSLDLQSQWVAAISSTSLKVFGGNLGVYQIIICRGMYDNNL